MMRWINEIKASYKDYDYIVKLYEDGHRTAYVKISPYEYERFKHDSFLKTGCPCHGGITFMEEVKGRNFLYDGYWIGFDALHVGDRLDVEEAEKAFNGKIYIEFKNLYLSKNGVIRTKEYMEESCKKTIDYLIDNRNSNFEDKCHKCGRLFSNDVFEQLSSDGNHHLCPKCCYEIIDRLASTITVYSNKMKHEEEENKIFYDELMKIMNGK